MAGDGKSVTEVVLPPHMEKAAQDAANAFGLSIDQARAIELAAVSYVTATYLLSVGYPDMISSVTGGIVGSLKYMGLAAGVSESKINDALEMCIHHQRVWYSEQVRNSKLKGD